MTKEERELKYPNGTANFNVRNFSNDLRKRLKMQAVYRGKEVGEMHNQVVEAGLELYEQDQAQRTIEEG